MNRSLSFLPAALAIALAATGCNDQPPGGPKYFERVIQPILTTNCVRGQGACHLDDGHGNALGNLDLSSYAGVSRRQDVLRTYGSYPLPLILLKASGGDVPPIPYKGATSGMTAFYPSEIQHAGGATLSVSSNAFFELQKWLENGATEDGSPAQKQQQVGTGGCRSDFATVRPDVAARLASVDTSTQAFKDFTANVEPLITKSCAFGTCHSSEQSDFFLTCKGDGGNDASKFNFLEAQSFVGTPPETSLLVRKPLAPAGGGIVHTGGVFFQSKSDGDWQKLSAWAAEAGALAGAGTLTDGERFFDDYVMPVLLRRGCALEGCHSPGAANDFKLRAGTQGFFSRFTLEYNYRVARQDFLNADVPDVRQSRLVKKPIVSMGQGGIGLTHRGGPPLETEGDSLDPGRCTTFDPKTSTALCTIHEWHRIEHQALIGRGQADDIKAGASLPLIVVVRPPDGDRLIDFDTYRPGADLVLGSATLDDQGAITGAAGGGTLIDKCPGVPGNDRSLVDVRHPAVSYDATRVAFAMRIAANQALDLYEVTLASHACARLTNGGTQTKNGMLLHSFDPMYSPDGALVFASTRGRDDTGPTRSLKYLLPQSDLWRMPASGGGGYGTPEQMTALLGSELGPAMMANGQVSFTAEKASADFYQLSGRRINWDLTDYHPLLGQRAQSRDVKGDLHPSVGYQTATEIREGVDRNFVLVLSDDGAKGGGGTIGLFNRSIGPFEADRTDIQFLKALTIVDPGATGHAGATAGAYRAPFPLPDGTILCSYAGNVANLMADTPSYDLVVLDPKTGQRRPLPAFSGGGKSHVEAVLAYKREPRQPFHNLTQLVFGGHVDASDPTHATVHYPDLPMLGTLLGANLRSGRFVDELRRAHQVVVYQDLPPPSDPAQAMGMLTGSQHVFQNRKELGRVDLASDGSADLKLPALTPLVLELSADGKPVFTMTEEDQLGPGEYISRGVPQKFFNSVCGGCHGSVSGLEVDIALDADALTGASVSLSRDKPQKVGP